MMRKDWDKCAMCWVQIQGTVECAALVELINLVQISLKLRKSNQQTLKTMEDEL